MSIQEIPVRSMDLQKQYLDQSLINNGKSDFLEKWFREATSQSQNQFGINTQGYVAPFFERPKVYGPPPQRVEDKTPPSGVNELFKQLKQKPSLEDILSTLFSSTEKEQFLLDMGYVLNWNHSDGSYDIYRMSPSKVKVYVEEGFETLFLREISIKFKNLLLSKSTLKLKL